MEIANIEIVLLIKNCRDVNTAAPRELMSKQENSWEKLQPYILR